MYDVLLFDLDGTLYPIANGYEAHVRSNLFDYMHQKLGVPRDQAEEVWRPLFRKHNQSLKGLRDGGYTIDAEEYWAFIRAGQERFLTRDDEVRRFLQSLPQPKWVITNCDEKHAKIAVEALGLQDCFQGVLGASFMGDSCKPARVVFEQVLKHLQADPQRTVMFEDSLKNLRMAKQLGMTTVLIAGPTLHEEAASASRSDVGEVVDVVVESPTEICLRDRLPQLWL
ncbi:hypothetical protein WJX72_000858 [[Myrmecia] bisecta]|uniref:Pyrimidine 5-nucleotidase n=1 Tax=[Myrmecia] bisecta TaxID=41462 RepID=A0AAW1QE32_9CHLO